MSFGQNILISAPNAIMYMFNSSKYWINSSNAVVGVGLSIKEDTIYANTKAISITIVLDFITVFFVYRIYVILSSYWIK